MPVPPAALSFDQVHWPALYARVEAEPSYPVLARADVARAVVMTLLRTARPFEVVAVAYCVMPDHVQLVLAALAPGGDTRTALRRWKQVSGAAHRRRSGTTLWRPRCAEHALRDATELWDAVRYLADTPVRAGLARVAAEYRWLSAPAASARPPGGAGRPPARPAWWPDRVTSGCRTGYSSPR
ncbi:MAG: hypothetical protein IT179_19210 [Acidobacteria bacterium]|nr:hypothetical protein [Acidobacteriota bacterium]